MEKEIEKIEIKVETINAVLGYLATKPYQEVQNLIGVLQQEAQVYIQNTEKEDM